MNVAVVGAGPVGVASAVVYAMAGHRVTLVERHPARVEALRAGRLPFYEAGLHRAWPEMAGRIRIAEKVAEAGTVDAVICCVGTPSQADGSADLTFVDDVLEEVAAGPPTLFVMRSTVPPGTGRRLSARISPLGHRYCAHPEFLREGSALEDSLRPSRLVVGADDPLAALRVFSLYPSSDSPRLTVDPTTAELVKLAANAHLAMRVSFINEIAGLAEIVGADIEAVAVGVGLDPRIGRSYLNAGLGYGGSCFPKDTRALCVFGRELGADLPMLRAAMEVNAQQPRAVVRRIERRLGKLRGQRVGVWGLAFKPGTDDTRESQALRVVDLLCAHGAEVRVHDPVAKCPEELRWSALQVDDPLEAAEHAEALVLATEWPVYRDLVPATVAARMAPPRLVVDARNALPAEAWLAAGTEYEGIARPASRPGLALEAGGH